MDFLMYVLPIIAIVAMVVYLFFKLKGNKSQKISTNDVNSNTYAETHSRDANFDRIVMHVEDVFNITGRGVVAIGTIQDIPISVDEHLNILDEEGNVLEVNVLIKGIEKSRELVKSAKPGESVGILLSVNKRLLRKGLILKKSNG